MATHHKGQIKCIQINLQHSRAATDNLMQIMSTGNIGLTFIQEPYIYQNKPKGISKGYRTYTHGEGKSRAAIIIACDKLDAILITQHSDNDTVLLEIHRGRNTYHAASVYMEHKEQIDTKLQKLERMIEFTKGAKLIIAVDSNARSAAWHDTKTTEGKRWKTLSPATNCI